MRNRSSRGRFAAFALAWILSASPALLTLPSTATAAPEPLAVINASAFAGTQYLIVTPAAYVTTMQPIADWKAQKGLPAKVASLDDVLATYAGRDNAEKLHNFLQDVYFNATSRTLTYLLLGGGASLVPIRYLRTNGSVIEDYTHDDVFSDVYYAGLNSDWDTNGNNRFGEYGEEDWDANVMVGRLPFRDLTQAQYARDNLLSYEKVPDVGPWMRQAVAFASVMDPPNYIPPAPPPYVYEWPEDNAIRSVWNMQPSIPSRMSLNILADYYELVGGNYTPLQDGLSNATMTAALSAGASVVISVTHGWVPSGRGLPEYNGANGIDYNWGQGLTYLNASGIANIGRLSAGYFSSCLVGNFSDPNLPNLASFTLLQDRGFVAMVLPTDGTLRGEDDYATFGIREGNWWQSENFWQNFFHGAQPYRMGPALYQGIRDYDRHIKDLGRDESWGGYRTQKAVYNLMGDPEVPIWTDVAFALNASLPGQLYAAPQHFRATYLDLFGRPVGGLTVALTGQGVMATGVTDGEGKVDIMVAPPSTGSIMVTASGANALPSQVTLPVLPAPPDLSLEPSDLVLPTPSLQAGVTVPISMRIYNLGQMTSNATQVTVEETAPGGSPTLVGSALALPSLAAGQSVNLSVDWTPTIDGIHALRVEIDASDLVTEFEELNNVVLRDVPVSSVDIALDLGSMVFEPPGNVPPGGALRVSGPIALTGSLPRGYLIGYKLSDDQGGVVLAGNLPASATQTSFSLSVRVAAAGDYRLAVTADFEDSILEFNDSNNEVVRAVQSGAGPALFQIPSIGLDEDAPATRIVADLRTYVSDPDTPFAALRFTASASNAGLMVWVDGTSLFALPAPNFFGSGTVMLEVSDGPHTSSVSSPFTVSAVNDWPVVAPIAPQTAAVGVPFTLQVNASDADGDPLVFSTQTPGATINSATGLFAFLPSTAMVGTTQLLVTVSDGHAAVQVAGALVVEPANRAPSIVPLGPVTIIRGQPTHYQVLALDPDGDPITFAGGLGSLSVDASGLVELDADATRALGPGTYPVVVVVTDGIDLSEGTVQFIVQDAPAAGPPAAFAEREEATTIALISIACVAAGLGIILAQQRRPKQRP